jgi:predicted phosphoribosyltransferase
MGDVMFSDRIDAGQRLASALMEYKRNDLIILAIPRGGVIVAHEVAKKLEASLDIVIPRKIRAPSQPELAIGAVTQDGTTLLNTEIIHHLNVSESYLQEEKQIQIEEINRRMRKYRGDRKSVVLNGKVVILIDDGIATGATVRAAIRSIRKQKPMSIIIAVPVGPRDTIEKVKKEADEVVCLDTPEPFFAISQFYRRFNQTSDEKVIRLLESYW